jgi:hypothetical protein
MRWFLTEKGSQLSFISFSDFQDSLSPLSLLFLSLPTFSVEINMWYGNRRERGHADRQTDRQDVKEMEWSLACEF